jgi:hypothetical protein
MDVTNGYLAGWPRGSTSLRATVGTGALLRFRGVPGDDIPPPPCRTPQQDLARAFGLTSHAGADWVPQAGP